MTVHLTGSATDPLNATAVSTTTAANTGATPAHTIRRYLHKDRIQYQSPADTPRNAGTPIHDGTPPEVGQIFHLQRNATFKGTRIYKAPAANGSIPVTLWDYATGTALSTVTLTWVPDGGGWVDVPMPAVALTAGPEYAISYFAASSDYVYTSWRFNAQDYIEYPFVVWAYQGTDGKDSFGNWRTGGCYLIGSHGFPSGRNAATFYYVDPYVEWTTDMPSYSGGSGYFAQWPNSRLTSAVFPVGVFAVDAGNLAGYDALGITHYTPGDGMANLTELQGTNLAAFVDLTEVRTVASDPTGWGARVVGYYVHDEPDLTGTYITPADLRTQVNAARAIDSTRPLWLNFGTPAAAGQGFYFLPSGATIDQEWVNFRAWATCGDILSLDDYTICLNTDGVSGVWQYGLYIDRLRKFNDDATPIWGFIETSTVNGFPHNPTAQEIISAMWMQIIHGATGLWFFDHQFPAAGVPQDFQVLLHDTAKGAAVKTAITRIQSLAAACWAPEAALCTRVTSSNTTAGPLGGTYGVPVDVTTRNPGAGTFYLFAIAARPGTTTAGFTVPAAAGKTVTVIGESRTVTADGSGVFTDNFSGDYQFHLYSWT